MIQVILIFVVLFLLFNFQSQFYKKRWRQKLDVRLRFASSEIREGEISALKVVIENAKKIPLVMLMVKFQTDKYLAFASQKGSVTTDKYYHNDVFQVGGGERVTRTLKFVGAKRGYYSINNVDLTSTDLFMQAQFHASFQPNETIYVLPRAIGCEEFRFLLQHLNGERITSFNIFEDPFELRGIREYQSYDNMRSINWKATAKTGRFMVNQRNFTAPQNAEIYLNLSDGKILHDDDDKENVIRLGVGLLEYLLSEGMKVGIGCNGLDIESNQPLIKEKGNDKNHVSIIMRSLARIDLTKEILPFHKLLGDKIRLEKDVQYFCFVSCDFDPDFISILETLSQQGRNYYWFLICPNSFNDTVIPPDVRKNMKCVHLD